jgi:hypothetical protein
MPGKATLLVKLNIPKEDDEGSFWVDLIALSSAPSSYTNDLERDDLTYKSNFTLKLSVVLPEPEIDADKSLLKKDGKKLMETGEVYLGDKIEVAVTIKNSGGAPVENTDIQLIIENNGITENILTKNFSVEAGESIELSWDYSIENKGRYSFSIIIDPDEILFGDNIHNNKLILTMPDPLPAPVKNQPSEPEKGSENILVITLSLIIIIIVIILMVVLFMFKKRTKKDEIDDLEENFGGPEMVEPVNDMRNTQRYEPTDRPVQFGSQAAPGTVAALAPKITRQPERLSSTGIICGECSLSNPPENKFCQNCGGKL